MKKVKGLVALTDLILEFVEVENGKAVIRDKNREDLLEALREFFGVTELHDFDGEYGDVRAYGDHQEDWM